MDNGHRNKDQCTLYIYDRWQSDFERLFSFLGITGTSVTAQRASVSIGTVTYSEVTSAFRSVGNTSVNRAGDCGRKLTFTASVVRALVWYVWINRSCFFN